MASLRTKVTIAASVVILLIAGIAYVGVRIYRDREERKKDPIAYEVRHQPAATDDTKLRNDLVGVWEMAATKSWGATEVTEYPQEHLHFKIFTLTNWTVIQYDSDFKVQYSAGGPYTLRGNNYSETIQEATGGMTQFLGHHPAFKIRIEGDKYYQIGAGKNPAIEEIWKRSKEEYLPPH